MPSLYFTADLLSGLVWLPDPRPTALWLWLDGPQHTSPVPAWLLTPDTYGHCWWKTVLLEDRHFAEERKAAERREQGLRASTIPAYPLAKAEEAAARLERLTAHAEEWFCPQEVAHKKWLASKGKLRCKLPPVPSGGNSEAWWADWDAWQKADQAIRKAEHENKDRAANGLLLLPVPHAVKRVMGTGQGCDWWSPWDDRMVWCGEEKRFYRRPALPV